MSMFAPSTSWTPTLDDLNGFAVQKPTTPCPPPCSLDDYADPPEMPDGVKAQGLNGMPCFYGFEFPDSAVVAYDKARGIKRPDGDDVQSWLAWRKRDIMNQHALALGIRFSAHLALRDVYDSGSPDASHEDVVHFAYMVQGRLVKSQCLTTQKIKEFMWAMDIKKGEPRWIVL